MKQPNFSKEISRLNLNWKIHVWKLKYAPSLFPFQKQTMHVHVHSNLYKTHIIF